MQNNRSAFADAGAHSHTKVQAFNSPEKEDRVYTPISKSKVAPSFNTPVSSTGPLRCLKVAVGIIETEKNGRTQHWPGVHFLRSDGCVEKMWAGGHRPKQIVFNPPHGKVYTALFASSSGHAGYLVRSDGVVDRGECDPGPLKQAPLEPPEHVKYTAANHGHGTMYFTRNDGLVDWVKGSGAFQGTIRASHMSKYVSVSTGFSACFLLREDGGVDWTKGNGEMKGTIRCREEGVQYVAACVGSHVSYLTRSDGLIDCVQDRGRVKSTVKPPSMPMGVKYTAAYTGPHTNFFLRSDGVVDYPIGNGEIKGSIKPPTGTQYVSVCTSESHSYLTRSDGVVDLVDWPSDGAVAQIHVGLPPEPQGGCCIVM